MQFNSFADFINMGGYGFYVWLSYGLTALLLALLIYSSISKHKDTIKQIAQRQQRESKLRQAAEQRQSEQQQEA